VVFDTDGNPIYLPAREGLRKQTPEQVATAIADLIARRRPRLVLTPMGKALYLIQRLWPGLIDLIYTRNLATIRQQASTPAERVG
jgi:hypothetical protein